MGIRTDDEMRVKLELSIFKLLLALGLVFCFGDLFVLERL